MTDAPPRIVERERIYDGWNRLDLLIVEAPDADGTLGRHKREIIDHGDAAVVLAVDRERQVALLVRQWRTGLVAVGAPDAYILEACAGIVDPGETPEQTARREAEEEMGLKLREIRSIGSVVPSVGTVTERMYLFVAEVTAADRTHAGGGVAHEGEAIEVVEVPLAELFAMAKDGRLEDAKTVIIVQRLMIEAMEAAT